MLDYIVSFITKSIAEEQEAIANYEFRINECLDLVTSAKGPLKQDIEHIIETLTHIKQEEQEHLEELNEVLSKLDNLTYLTEELKRIL